MKVNFYIGLFFLIESAFNDQQLKAPSYNYVNGTFKAQSGIVKHVVHKGKILLGLEDNLTVIDQNLRYIQSVRSNPDSTSTEECYPKSMIIYGEKRELILCCTSNRGSCHKRKLNDGLSLSDDYVKSEGEIVPWTKNSSCLMVIAPGPGARTYAYIANTLPQDTDAQLSVVSRRNLTNFLIVHKSFYFDRPVLQAKKYSDQNGDIFDERNIHFWYIKGFTAFNFVHFLVVEPLRLSSYNVFVTRIQRICMQDENFSTHAELDLKCYVGGIEHNIVTSAHIGRGGETLQKDLELPHLEPFSDDDLVLFATFSTSAPYSAIEQPGSAVCAYRLRDIRKYFTNNIQECYNGIGTWGPDYFTSQAQNCIEHPETIGDKSCPNKNKHILGTQPLAATALLHIPNHIVSSFAVTTVDKHTIAFMGTKAGIILKVSIQFPNRIFDALL